MNLAKLEAQLFLAEPVEYEKELRSAGTPTRSSRR